MKILDTVLIILTALLMILTDSFWAYGERIYMVISLIGAGGVLSILLIRNNEYLEYFTGKKGIELEKRN